MAPKLEKLQGRTFCARAVRQAALHKVRSAAASRFSFFAEKRLTQSAGHRIIYIDDTRPNHRGAPSARQPAAGDRGDAARLAARADRAPHQRRRAPAVGSDLSYAGGRTRQFSLRREQVDEVRRWLGNYHKLKEALEDICELNHALLRPDSAAPRRARKNP